MGMDLAEQQQFEDLKARVKRLEGHAHLSTETELREDADKAAAKTMSHEKTGDTELAEAVKKNQNTGMKTTSDLKR